MNILTALIAGAAQGITEWLPISSEAVLTLIFRYMSSIAPSTAVEQAIVFHLGSTAAATIYFRNELFSLLKDLPETLTDKPSNTLFWQLFIATAATAIIGAPIYYYVLPAITASASTLAVIMAAALAATGVGRLYSGAKERSTITLTDSSIAGILQGTAIIPGISRSGTTVFGLLFQGIDAESAFRLSFLMSIPAVLGANAAIFFEGFAFTTPLAIGIIASFIVSLAAIDVVLRIADHASIAMICFLLAAVSLAPLFI